MSKKRNVYKNEKQNTKKKTEENKNRIVIYSVNYFMAELDEFRSGKLYQLVQILSYLSSKKSYIN